MRRLMGILLLGALAVAACSSGEASGPPEINYGRDICTRCGMVISDARFATAVRTADGTELKFDDVGGMVLYLRETGEEPPADATWVHDFETAEWILAADAFYVPTLSVASPMGHSILSFGDEARANAVANDVDGTVIGWETVRELPATDGLLGEHHHDDMEDDESGHDGHDG